jgi:hypothetical protein
VLKTILELKGEKRFRRQRAAGLSTEAKQAITVDDLLNSKDMSQAKTAFRKISVKSSYNRQFGERPKEEEAFHIIKKKKFSELDFAAILKSEPLRIIEKWVGVDNEEEFTARVFFTLREMYTIVRGKSIFSTTMRDHFIDKP